MTEQEWLECADPTPMLKFQHGGLSDRKLRLFACACYRRVLHLLNENKTNQKTIEFAERLADGLATKRELIGNAWGKTGEVGGCVQSKAIAAAEYSAEHANGLVEQTEREFDPELCKTWEIAFEAAWEQFHLGEAMRLADAAMPSDWVARGRAFRHRERQMQADLLRETVGNPFRHVAMETVPVTSKVETLAQAIYDERRFADMPILADALEEAGCTEADILNHCRQPGDHVCRCWVVDLVLGKG